MLLTGRSLLGVVNEPFAAATIYSAVLAAWTYLARRFAHWRDPTTLPPRSGSDPAPPDSATPRRSVSGA